MNHLLYMCFVHVLHQINMTADQNKVQFSRTDDVEVEVNDVRFGDEIGVHGKLLCDPSVFVM